MIHFVEAQSIYFDRNKAFCESIQKQLPDFVFEGECNAFGYNFTAESRDYSRTKFQFKKAQYTGKMLDAHYNYEVDISAFIQNKNVKFIVEKSAIKRLLMSQSLKKIVSKPYFVDTNFSDEKTSDLFQYLIRNNIDSLRIDNGKITIKLFRKTEHPMDILNYFLEQIND